MEPRTWTATGLALATRPELASATGTALRLLRQHAAFDLWMVTRIDDDSLVVLDCTENGYGLRPGHVVPYAASLDWRMVHGQGPRVAPRVTDVPAYATAGVTQVMPVAAFAAAPLVVDGEVFGTLSAYDPLVQPPSLVTLGPTLDGVAALLSNVLALELRASQVVRRAERAEVEAHVDPLTQVGNRLAWTKVLVEEEARCRRYGRPACVISVDLDGLKKANDQLGHDAGDRLLRSAALVLRRVSRMCDQVARVGGDEFGVIAVEASELEGRQLLDRISSAFTTAGIEASVGMAVRENGATLDDAWKAADAAMYRHKRRRLQERVSAAFAAPPEVAPRVVVDLPSMA
ncbi:MAG TPA: sensor domain-containing diguanylate cyclase [Frankiaceae bacterium]|jgi:diguanylate cyclase (GGDEF)-like protein|nr:sensor domain-containing diguanylate cyclase [Frankiaceae bacterium]